MSLHTLRSTSDNQPGAHTLWRCCMFKRSGRLLFLIVLLSVAGAGCRGDGSTAETLEITGPVIPDQPLLTCDQIYQHCCTDFEPNGTWVNQADSLVGVGWCKTNIPIKWPWNDLCDRWICYDSFTVLNDNCLQNWIQPIVKHCKSCTSRHSTEACGANPPTMKEISAQEE